jgi:hypothetical protein
MRIPPQAKKPMTHTTTIIATAEPPAAAATAPSAPFGGAVGAEKAVELDPGIVMDCPHPAQGPV